MMQHKIDQEKPTLLRHKITRKQSESSVNQKSNELQVPTKPTDTIQQLRTLNTKKRGKSPTRSKSNTKQNKDEQLQIQTEQLKEVKVLKNNNKTETTNNTDKFKSTETPKQNSKDLQIASDSQGDQQQNMEII